MQPRIGELRHRLTFQAGTKVADGAGGFTMTWTDDFSLWGSVVPLSAQELLIHGQEAGITSYKVHALYQQDMLPTTLHRVVWGDKVCAISAPIKDIDNKHVWIELIVSYKDSESYSAIPVLKAVIIGVTGTSWYFLFSENMTIPTIYSGCFTGSSNRLDNPFAVSVGMTYGQNHQMIICTPVPIIYTGDVVTVSSGVTAIYSAAGKVMVKVTHFAVINNSLVAP